MVRDVVNDRGVNEQRNDARGIGFEREFHHVEGLLRAAHEFFGVGNIFGRLGGDDGFGPRFPFLRAVQSLFQFAHRRVILIHARLVGDGQRTIQAFRLVADEIEQTAALFQRFYVGRHFLRVALNEQAFVKFFRAAFGWNLRAIARVTERAIFIGHGQHQ